MNWLHPLRLRFRALFQKEKLDTQMDDEMRSHIEMQTQENIEAGMKPEEARYAALRQFGRVEAIKEACRDQRGVCWLENLFQDIRYGARRLRRSPGFTAVAVLTLALGIGANTVIFSLVNALLLRTVSGVTEPQQLAAFEFKEGEMARRMPLFSYPDFVDLRQSVDVFSDMAASGAVDLTVNDETQTARIQGLLVTPNWFRMLGVPMRAGRGFTADEGQVPGADPVAVISEGLWRRMFNADLAVIGRTVRLNGTTFTILGVAAPFRVNPVFMSSEVWIPLTMHAAVRPRSPAAGPRVGENAVVERLLERNDSWLTWLARLKAGSTLAQAEAAVAVRARQIAEAYPKLTLLAHPLAVRSQQSAIRARVSAAAPVALFLSVLGGLVLLIACANLANLLLARATTRQQEMAIRQALGARRGRLARQLLTENLLLALLGGSFGLLFCFWATSLLTHLLGNLAAHAGIAFRLDAGIEPPVFGFALLMALGAGLMFGLAPALATTRPQLVSALKGSHEATARGRFSWRGALVIAQVAVSFLLLIVSGLFARSLYRAHTVDLGFQPDGLLVLSVSPEALKIPAAEMSGLRARMADAVGRLPGVISVSYARNCQGEEDFNYYALTLPADLGTNYFSHGNIVDPGYFDTLRMPLVKGRAFSAADAAGPPVVVVNETMADRFWPGADPVGQSLKVGQNGPGAEPVWATVIGVAQDSHYLFLSERDRRAFLYRPEPPQAADGATIFIRVTADPRTILPALRRELTAVDARIPVAELGPLNDRIALWRLGPKLGALFVGTAGGAGLLLAALGLYGVLAYLVGQRTREIGIRMALGATRGVVVSLVLWQGARLVLTGAALGLVVALAATRVIAGLLFGVTPLDPLAFLGVSIVLMGVAFLACWLPARRAARVNPMVALRSE